MPQVAFGTVGAHDFMFFDELETSHMGIQCIWVCGVPVEWEVLELPLREQCSCCQANVTSE